MPYGKTQPIEYVCQETGMKCYPRRANKKMEKFAPLKKYCSKLRKITEWKPKVCKHST